MKKKKMLLVSFCIAFIFVIACSGYENFKLIEPRTYRENLSSLDYNNYIDLKIGDALVVFKFRSIGQDYKKNAGIAIAITKNKDIEQFKINSFTLYSNGKVLVGNESLNKQKGFSDKYNAGYYSSGVILFEPIKIKLTPDDTVQIELDAELKVRDNKSIRKRLNIPLKVINKNSPEWKMGY